MAPCPCFSASACQRDLVTHWAVRIDWGSLELAAETRTGILASACHVWSPIPPEQAHSHGDAPLTAAHTAHTHFNLLYICTNTNFYTISWAAMLNPLTYSTRINSPPVCHSLSLCLPQLWFFFFPLSTLSAKWRRLHCSIWPILAEVRLDNKTAVPAKKTRGDKGGR